MTVRTASKSKEVTIREPSIQNTTFCSKKHILTMMLIKWNVTNRGWSGWWGVRDIRRGGRVREYWSGAPGHRVPPTALPSEMTWESKPEKEARNEQITHLLLRDHED